MSGAAINHVIHAIPENTTVTVFHAGGQLRGVDDTTGEEAEKGLFAMICHTEDPYTHLRGKTIRAVLAAWSVTGFHVDY